MRDINTMSKKAYMYENILYTFIAFLLFDSSYFKTVLSNFEGKIDLLIISLCLLYFSYLITYKRRRNHFTVFINVMMPIEFILAYTYFLMPHTQILIIVLFSVATVVSIIYIALFVVFEIKGKTKSIKHELVSKLILGIRTIFVVSFTALPIGIVVNNLDLH